MSHDRQSDNTQSQSFLFTRDKELSQEAAEDYAGRKVPFHWKRPVRSLAVTMFGSATSVFAFAMGGEIALSSGMPTLMIALAISFIVSVPMTIAVMWHTSGRSIDTDLLSRAVGYGYRGSAFTALIYALNWIMYSGLETAYLASAVYAQTEALPLWVLYLIAAAIVVPINWFGISQLHWIQKWSVPIFAIGLIWVIVAAVQQPAVAQPLVPEVGLDTVLPAVAAVFANVGIWILLIADYSRFVKAADRKKAIVAASTIGLGAEFIVLPLIGGWLAIHVGSANPGTYAVGLAGIVGLVWVLITQLRVQEGNYYLGSLALSTFTSRVFHLKLPRPVYLIVIGVFAFLMAAAGIVNHLTDVLTFMGIFLMAWVGTLAGVSLTQRKALNTGKVWLEHRRPYIKEWGAPALIGLVIAVAVGASLALAPWFDPYGGFAGIVASTILAPVITLIGSRGNPVTAIHSAAQPADDWIDRGDRFDEYHAAPENHVTCEATGAQVMKIDACEWPVGSGRTVSARNAEIE